MTEQAPGIGWIVHYVSYGTPGGEYTSRCRAAIITEISPISDGDDQEIASLCVLNPTGQFFIQDCVHDEGSETPDADGCLSQEHHGDPFRYCQCGWIEASHRYGTWHWPERVGA